jgi:hypothetical protein
MILSTAEDSIVTKIGPRGDSDSLSHRTTNPRVAACLLSKKVVDPPVRPRRSSRLKTLKVLRDLTCS